MKNTSRSNLLMQYKVLIDVIENEINSVESELDIVDFDCDEMIECIEGIRQIKVALRTLTN